MSVNSEVKTDNGLLCEAEAAERRALVQRIAVSPHLNKSPRLRDVLWHLAESSLSGAAEGLHEQEIGVRVFGRPPAYDTGQDNIVRVQVSQLRKKIEKYFLAEGIDEPLILEIPKGGYVPVFRARALVEAAVPDAGAPDAAAAPVAPGPVAPEQKTSARSGYRRLPLALALLAVILVGVCGWLLNWNLQLRRSATSQLDQSPALKSLWSQLLVKDQRTDIVIADALLTFVRDKLDQPITVSDYIRRNYGNSLPPALPEKDRNHLRSLMTRRYTGVADANFVARVMQLLNKHQVQPAITFARDYQLRDLKSQNAILLGSKQSNPWVELFEEQTNFRVAVNEQTRERSILNVTPQAGEKAIYKVSEPGAGYALIAFLPNLNRSGNVLILQGLDMGDTEAATEFATTEEVFAKFQTLIAHTENKLPWFEVLIETKKTAGSARAFEVVAYRLPRLESLHRPPLP